MLVSVDAFASLRVFEHGANNISLLPVVGIGGPRSHVSESEPVTAVSSRFVLVVVSGYFEKVATETKLELRRVGVMVLGLCRATICAQRRESCKLTRGGGRARAFFCGSM